MLENKFNKTDVVDIFDTLFYQDEKVDISEKLSDLYNSLYPDSEKEKMLYMLKHEYVFSFDECKKLQKQLPIYYDKTKGKKAGTLIKRVPVFYRLTRYCYDKFWKR